MNAPEYLRNRFHLSIQGLYRTYILFGDQDQVIMEEIANRYEAMEAMLRRLEHQGRDVLRNPICPVCLAMDVDSHGSECELAALLKGETT